MQSKDLKWNDHAPNLISKLASFQQKGWFADVTISCEGHNIEAHKIVLSASSPYFQNILLDNPDQHPIIFMNGMKFEDISAILNFMYKGEVNVSHDGLSSFLQAAEALKVKGLTEVCAEKNSTNSICQEVQQSEQSGSFANFIDTFPPRREFELYSPDVTESLTGDNSSNGISLNEIPQTSISSSYQPSSNLGDEEDYERGLSEADARNSSEESEISDYESGEEVHAVKEDSTPHKRSQVKSHICEFCNKGFLFKSRLKEHLRTHTKEKPFVCEICKKDFQRKNHLKVHLKVHTQEKPFECEICKKTFALKQNMKTHLRLHTQEKPFRCVYCEKTFSQKPNLDTHLRFHTGEKPFECEICKKKFRQMGHLKKHLRLHTQEKPFACDRCKKTFRHRNTLNVHQRVHTKEKKL